MSNLLAAPALAPRLTPALSADIDLTAYDVILANTSGGKDSMCMLEAIVSLAREQGVADRVQAVHADLGRVEWAGTRELAEEQCKHWGVKLSVVSRPQGDLLAQVESHGKWPSSAARFCTSDHKRAQVYKLLTQLAAEHRASGKTAPLRILNCLGLRAQESSARAKKTPFERDAKASNTRRTVDTWFPIFGWTEEEVWASIHASGVRYHRAYALGMPRLSCAFCVLASQDALLLAGHHNRELLATYVAVEKKIGHDFKHHLPIAQIQARVEAGEMPKGKINFGCSL